MPKLLIPHDLAKLIQHLHPDLKRKVKAALKLISSSDEAGKPLKEELEGLRSLRVNRFRIVFRYRENVVEIVALGPRLTIYRETYRRLRKP